MVDVSCLYNGATYSLRRLTTNWL